MRESDAEVHPAAQARRSAALKRAVGGWALGVAGVVYAFVFREPIGFVVAGAGFGILSIDNALKALGK